MRRLTRLLWLVVIGAVPILLAWFIGSRAPATAPIDAVRELHQVTRDEQGASDTTPNGWGDLETLSDELDALIKERVGIEMALDGDRFGNGEEPEPWSRDVSLWPMCPDDIPVRDRAITRDFLRELRESGFMDRVHRASRAECFVSDFEDRPGARILAEGLGGFVPDRGGARQKISMLIAAEVRDAIESGDWDRAGDAFDSAMRFTRAMSVQADASNWFASMSYRAQQVRWFVSAVIRRGDVPESVVASALASIREYPVADGAHVLKGERVILIESADATEEVMRRKFWGAVARGSGRGPAFDKERAAVGAALAAAVRVRGGPVEARLEMMARHGAPDFSRKGELHTGEMAAYIFAQVVGMDVYRESMCGGCEVTLAVLQHAARHGAPPASIEAIDADILARAPSDPMARDGRYGYIASPTAEGMVVYSVGQDRVDDGGVRRAVSIGPFGPVTSGTGDELFVVDECAEK